MRLFYKNIFFLALLINISACGNTQIKPFNPNSERKYFGVAVRKLPPEPVYNRLMTAYLPEPLPNRDFKKVSFTRLNPVFQFEMKDATIEETARVLANIARYTSYCSSVIASRKINLTTVGTIDEIGQYIGEKAGIKVVVDHANHEVRFLANGASTVAKNQTEGAKIKTAAKEEVNQTPGGLSPDVQVSEKTNGFLNKIKVD